MNGINAPSFSAQQDQIEPGLLSVFTLFMGLHLTLVLLSAAARFAFGDPAVLLSSYLSVVWLTILLGYLSWPAIHARLGRAYLPIALAIASLMPLLERVLVLLQAEQVSFTSSIEPVIIGSSWRLILALFVPLILISWQYRFGIVSAFIAGTTLLDLGLLWGIGAVEEPHIWSLVGMTLTRAVLFLAVGYIVTRLMSAQRLQRQNLANANRQIAHYASTIEQLTVSRERNRMARELHDTLAHTLSALSVQLEAVDSAWDTTPDRARSLLIKAIANTRSGLTETRRALQALRASPVEDLGLALAIRNLAETTASRGGMHLDVQVPDQVENVSPDVEQTVYRITQEALENTVRHAGAKNISLTLHKQNGHLLLRVVDDGQGFDPGDVDAAIQYGLRGMQERAALVGAALSVDSQPGKGTAIQLEVENGR